jgi:hypothetical protein
MNECGMQENLMAYYDGELTGATLIKMEQHLLNCETCQAELRKMRNLSSLLQVAPAVVPSLSRQKFAAQVALQLGTQVQPPMARSVLRLAWKWLPIGLVAAWAFAQAAFMVAGVVIVLNGLGLPLDWLLEASLALPFPGKPASFWWAAGEGFLTWLSLDGMITLVLGGLFLGWTVSWLVERRHNLIEKGVNNGSL